MMLFVIVTIVFIAFLIYFLAFAGKKKAEGTDLGEHHRGRASGTTTYNNPTA